MKNMPGHATHVLTILAFSDDFPGIGGNTVITWNPGMDDKHMLKIAEFVIDSAIEIIEKRAEGKP